MQNFVFTVEIMKAQQAILAERERANTGLLERVVALSSKKKQADDKITSFWVEMNHKSGAQQQQEGELDRLRGELVIVH